MKLFKVNDSVIRATSLNDAVKRYKASVKDSQELKNLALEFAKRGSELDRANMSHSRSILEKDDDKLYFELYKIGLKVKSQLEKEIPMMIHTRSLKWDNKTSSLLRDGTHALYWGSDGVNNTLLNKGQQLAKEIDALVKKYQYHDSVKDSIASEIISKIKKAYPEINVSQRSRIINNEHVVIFTFSNVINNSNFKQFLRFLAKKYTDKNTEVEVPGSSTMLIQTIRDSLHDDDDDDLSETPRHIAEYLWRWESGDHIANFPRKRKEFEQFYKDLKKEVEKMLKRGYDYNIKRVKDSVKDSSIELDIALDNNADAEKYCSNLARKYGCQYKKTGSMNGWPTYKFTGLRANLEKLAKEYGMDKEDFDAFVEDSVHDDELDDLSNEERQAIEDYRTAIQNTTNPKLLELYAHILQEETEHLKELQSAKATDK